MKNRVKATKKLSRPRAVSIDAEQVFLDTTPAHELFFYNEIDGWQQMQNAFKHKVNRPKSKRETLVFTPGFFSISDQVE
jgi:hypothetical protein